MNKKLGDFIHLFLNGFGGHAQWYPGPLPHSLLRLIPGCMWVYINSTGDQTGVDCMKYKGLAPVPSSN